MRLEEARRRLGTTKHVIMLIGASLLEVHSAGSGWGWGRKGPTDSYQCACVVSVVGIFPSKIWDGWVRGPAKRNKVGWGVGVVGANRKGCIKSDEQYSKKKGLDVVVLDNDVNTNKDEPSYTTPVSFCVRPAFSGEFNWLAPNSLTKHIHKNVPFPEQCICWSFALPRYLLAASRDWLWGSPRRLSRLLASSFCPLAS